MSRPRPRRHPRRTRVVVLITVLVALAIPVGGLAYGYWSTTGVGAGSGTTGTVTALTLSPGTPTAALYPGGQTGVVLTVSNPNTSPIHVTSLNLDTTQGTAGFAVDGGHAGCALGVLSFTSQTNGGAGWTIPARVGVVNGTLAVTLTNALAMSTSAANACQGATFTVYLAAS